MMRSSIEVSKEYKRVTKLSIRNRITISLTVPLLNSVQDEHITQNKSQVMWDYS